ncbi:sulfite exporter TauE/SafE family protein [Gallibacterium anatis]|nr:sulfite exporter TauE/SafE family protein [Gallibacterium anatis]MDK9429325.1 sulfite exporter TauE/SafE family protein [Gallibacterium anatis]MDK9559856.1 sulfite exporter TauE/SafE family protein [Gallibacterium anatis]WIM78699.1 sulfite exporter TauE/SafE family protein [Gallibacterium anatis]WIM81204.1 sulfite exporter TauE/SafE family protein [Gallibacterium anatis]
MDINVLLILSCIIFLGSFTQGLTGFGLALVSVPLLSMCLDVKLAIPIAGIFGWLVTFPIVWKMRKNIKWKITLILFVGSLPGSLLGANLLKYLPSEVILISMGIILVVSSLYSLFSTVSLIKKESYPISLLMGFLSGSMGASVGEAGPPVIAYTSMMPWTNDETKATLVSFFMLQMIGAIIGFWNKDLLTGEVFSHIVSMFPAFIIGLLLGLFGYQLMHKYNINYHKIIYCFLIVIGSILILQNLVKI